ncbi:MAG: TolB family protein, partial [Planctomycetota bacterium]
MTRWHSIVLLVLITVIMIQAPAAGNLEAVAIKAATDSKAELKIQYETLLRNIANRRRISRYAEQVYRADAMIDKADRDPLDVVVRRTSALLDDLQRMPFAPDFSQMAARLKELQKASTKLKVTNRKQRFELFKKACRLRLRIALSNPLLDFDKILFIKRHRATFNHMCDQYYGINVLPGGGIYVLSDPFGDNPQVRDVLANSVVQRGRLKGQRLKGGSVLSPDLSYDGKTIVFAYVECKGDRNHRYHTDPSRGHWNKQRCYHIFKVNVDGSGLEQLTDGTWNDFDPCWLPNGRLAFISERRGGYLRCGRVCPTYTLHDINNDGSDIRCLSLHETNEWHPSITNDGRIIYTRWDYVDRHGCTAHLPWITTPDGRDSRAVHGNFAPRELRADMELDVRAIPGSHKFVATGAPHHGQAFGSLVIFDPHVEDDDIMAPVKRLTPEVDFPETQGGAQVYGT